MSSVTLPPEGVATRALRDLVPPLKTPRASRVVVVGCGTRVHFPWDKTVRRYESAVAETRAALGDAAGLDAAFDVVRAEAPFEDPAALLGFLDAQLQDGVAGVLLFHASYTTGELGIGLARWLTDHNVPLLSWSFPDPRNGSLEANSLCCQNFLLNMMRTMGVKYAWMHGEVGPEAHETLQRFGRSVRARDRFKNSVALHVGGSRVSGFYDGEADEFAIMKRFGLRFDRIDLQAAFDHAKKFDDKDVKKLRDAIVESPRCKRNDVPDEQIFQTLRIGLAAMDMAAERGYIGCTIKSWPELFDQYGCATDGSVSMLNDAGLCTAEEGDMLGLVSSLALFLVSEGRAVPSMMDLSGLDAAADRIAIWHCGACPTRLLKQGEGFEARKHTVLEQADPASAVGLMLEFLLQTGDATVVRYTAPGAAQSFSFEGELVDTPLVFRGNYAEMVPSDATAERIMGTIMGRGLDHHWSLGFGRWKQELRMLDHWLGVETLEVSHAGGSSGLSQGL